RPARPRRAPDRGGEALPRRGGARHQAPPQSPALPPRPPAAPAPLSPAGARGIKLHPRAQRFLLDDQRLEPIFALAAERRVPILIHGGRGLPPIAAHLRRLHAASPGGALILAQGGIAALPALAERFAGKAG